MSGAAALRIDGGAMGEPCPLTDYQRAVLQWMANGKTNYEIAGIMSNSTEDAIQKHVARIMDLLGASNRTGAVAIGLRKGWIT